MFWPDNNISKVHLVRLDDGGAFQMIRQQRVKRRRSPVASWAVAIPGGHRVVDHLYAVADRLKLDQFVDPSPATAH